MRFELSFSPISPHCFDCSHRTTPKTTRDLLSLKPVGSFLTMGWFADILGYVAPLFIVMSPILSYSDQVISMQRNKSSAGFSLDIPLIMLVASFLRSETIHHAVFLSALLTFCLTGSSTGPAPGSIRAC